LRRLTIAFLGSGSPPSATDRKVSSASHRWLIGGGRGAAWAAPPGDIPTSLITDEVRPELAGLGPTSHGSCRFGLWMPILDLPGTKPARSGSRVLDMALPGKSAGAPPRPPHQPRYTALGIARCRLSRARESPGSMTAQQPTTCLGSERC
jgi:hypothetical protein